MDRRSRFFQLAGDLLLGFRPRRIDKAKVAVDYGNANDCIPE